MRLKRNIKVKWLPPAARRPVPAIVRRIDPGGGYTDVVIELLAPGGGYVEGDLVDVSSAHLSEYRR